MMALVCGIVGGGRRRSLYQQVSLWLFLLLSWSIVRPEATVSAQVEDDNVEPFLLTSTNKHIIRMNMDGTNATILVNDSKISGVDYHYRLNLVFWVTKFNSDLKCASLTDGSNVTAMLVKGIDKPIGIAVDWINDRVYWVDVGLNGVYSYNLKTKQTMKIFGLHEAQQIKIYPQSGNNGFIYMGNRSNHQIMIYRLHEESSQQMQSLNNIPCPTLMSINYQMKDIYWLDKCLYQVVTSKFDGSNRHTVIPTQTMFLSGSSVHQNHLYMAIGGSTSYLKRFDIENNRMDDIFAIDGQILRSVYVIGASTQPSVTIMDCEQSCVHGNCTQLGMCTCANGWTGPTCALPIPLTTTFTPSHSSPTPKFPPTSHPVSTPTTVQETTPMTDQETTSTRDRETTPTIDTTESTRPEATPTIQETMPTNQETTPITGQETTPTTDRETTLTTDQETTPMTDRETTPTTDTTDWESTTQPEATPTTDRETTPTIQETMPTTDREGATTPITDQETTPTTDPAHTSSDGDVRGITDGIQAEKEGLGQEKLIIIIIFSALGIVLFFAIFMFLAFLFFKRRRNKTGFYDVHQRQKSRRIRSTDLESATSSVHSSFRDITEECQRERVLQGVADLGCDGEMQGTSSLLPRPRVSGRNALSNEEVAAAPIEIYVPDPEHQLIDHR